MLLKKEKEENTFDLIRKVDEKLKILRLNVTGDSEYTNLFYLSTRMYKLLEELNPIRNNYPLFVIS